MRNIRGRKKVIVGYIYNEEESDNDVPLYRGEVVKLCPFISLLKDRNCRQARCAMWRWTDGGTPGYCALAGKLDT